MQLDRKSLAFGQLPSTKGDLYSPATGNKGLVHNVVFHNTNTSAETVELYYHDGTNEYLVLKQSIDADDTFIWDFRGAGDVIEDGAKLTGNTTTAAKVTYKFSGTEETPSAAVASGGGGAEVLWEWNGTDITQFGDGAGNPDFDYGTHDGTLSVGAVPGSGVDVPSGNVLIYTTGTAVSAQAYYLINDLPVLPERFIYRARMGPRVSNNFPLICFAAQDELHHMQLVWNNSNLLRMIMGNNSDGMYTSGLYNDDLNAISSKSAGLVVEADCMLIDPSTGVDPQINVMVRAYGDSVQVTGKGDTVWSAWGGSAQPYASSWQSGGTIKQPGVSFLCNAVSQALWVGELQILSHPWT